ASTNAHSFTITATSGSLSHSVPAQLFVTTLDGTIAPSAATIQVGSSANFTVSLTATDGFAGPVNLVCSGLTSGLACSFNPGQVNLPANGVTSTLTVSVASKPSISPAAPPAATPGGPLSLNLPLPANGAALLISVVIL